MHTRVEKTVFIWLALIVAGVLVRCNNDEEKKRSQYEQALMLYQEQNQDLGVPACAILSNTQGSASVPISTVVPGKDTKLTFTELYIPNTLDKVQYAVVGWEATSYEYLTLQSTNGVINFTNGETIWKLYAQECPIDLDKDAETTTKQLQTTSSNMDLYPAATGKHHLVIWMVSQSVPEVTASLHAYQL